MDSVRLPCVHSTVTLFQSGTGCSFDEYVMQSGGQITKGSQVVGSWSGTPSNGIHVVIPSQKVDVTCARASTSTAQSSSGSNNSGDTVEVPATASATSTTPPPVIIDAGR